MISKERKKKKKDTWASLVYGVKEKEKTLGRALLHFNISMLFFFFLLACFSIQFRQAECAKIRCLSTIPRDMKADALTKALTACSRSA